ncbi:MAG: sporulation integral membrane protein YtvI [Lachnospiraceae bacterium]|nr:sporulation integral membrane protein YtvI [Lachnospiraceae bacterium]
MNSTKVKYVKALLNILVTVVGVLLAVWLLPKFMVYFMPFIIGWLIACIAGPMVRFLEEKLKLKRKAGSVFVIIVVIGLVILGIYLVGSKLIRELLAFIEDLPVMWAGLKGDLKEIQSNMSGVMQMLPQNVQDTVNSAGSKINEIAMNLVEQFSMPTIEALGDFAKQVPAVIIGIIMCLLSAYFFVAERGSWFEPVKKVLPPSFLARWNLVKNSVKRAVGGYFKAQLKIEIWIYLLLVIGLLILQVDYVLLIALGIALLDFFPFFGTGTVMVPWAIIKFLSADYKMTIGLLIVWGVGQLVRQVIQPKIMGDSMGMAPLPTLVLLYIGYRVAGVIGMILAVPIGIIVETMYKEGVFETTQKSFQILSAGINRFRRLREEDMEEVKMYKKERDELYADLQESDNKK